MAKPNWTPLKSLDKLNKGFMCVMRETSTKELYEGVQDYQELLDKMRTTAQPDPPTDLPAWEQQQTQSIKNTLHSLIKVILMPFRRPQVLIINRF